MPAERHRKAAVAAVIGSTVVPSLRVIWKRQGAKFGMPHTRCRV